MGRGYRKPRRRIGESMGKTKAGQCEQCEEYNNTLVKFRSVFVCISCEELLELDDKELRVKVEDDLSNPFDRIESSLYDDYQNDY